MSSALEGSFCSPGSAGFVARSEERRVGKEGRSRCDWSSDVCSSDLELRKIIEGLADLRIGEDVERLGGLLLQPRVGELRRGGPHRRLGLLQGSLELGVGRAGRLRLD